MTAVATQTIRAAIYVRISLDREGGGLGVKRQEEDCRALANERGWTVAEVYVDNDTSATSKKPRPEYQRMLADARAGRIDAIVGWHIDRLTRKPRELEDLIDLFDDNGIQLATVKGEANLATDTGQLVARILASLARQEAQHMSERRKRRRQQDAEAGKPHQGGTRPYGYKPDRVTPDPVEAAFVRDAARRVLAGESLRSVAIDMNERGARTSGGKPWSPSMLKQVLRTARISGRRETWTTKSSKGIGTIVAVDCWEPIITPEQSDKLRAMFSDPARQSHTRSTRAKYLLSGILRCGKCGKPMTALAWEKGGKYLYRCPPAPVGCGRLSVLMKYAEPVVRNLALELIGRGDFRDRLNERAQVDPAIVESVREDEETLEDLAGMMARGDMSRAEWKVARDVIQTRVETNKAMLKRQINMQALDLLDPDGDLVDQWDKLNTSQQRAVLGEVLDHVTVLPTDRRGEKFDPRRLVPEWRL